MTTRLLMRISDGLSSTLLSRLSIASVCLIGATIACTSAVDSPQASTQKLTIAWNGKEIPDLTAILGELDRAIVQLGFESAVPTTVVAYGHCTTDELTIDRLLIDNIQARSTLFGQQAIKIQTIVSNTGDTEITWLDETAHYPSTDPLDMTTMPFDDAIRLISKGLVDLKECDQDITVAKVAANDWSIRCGPPDKVFITCYRLDSGTGLLVP